LTNSNISCTNGNRNEHSTVYLGLLSVLKSVWLCGVFVPLSIDTRGAKKFTKKQGSYSTK